MTEDKKTYKLLYPKEPVRFGAADVDSFVAWCTENDTSDITIQNEEEVRCEIHGKIYRVTKRRLSRPEVMAIISHIYTSDAAISRLNAGQDVDLPWTIKISRTDSLRFRVNMTSCLTEGSKGYSLTIRTIKNRPQLLETLNLPQEIIDNIAPKQGLIAIVGATGSGKSTLLASVLDWRMRDPEAHLKILTYEAPIEYVYDEVDKPSSIISQTEIGEGGHLHSFEQGVRNALRRKPSIILMGEMRDKETIGEGVTASMTGHLVYGTLHVNGVSDTVRRMVNVFSTEEKNARAVDILTSLKMIVAQMLVPSTDGKRVAIREYLVFNRKIVDHLMECKLENLTHETRKMLDMYGQSFIQDARKKFEAGLIDEIQLKEIEKISEDNSRKEDEEIKQEEKINVNVKDDNEPKDGWVTL